MTHQEISTSILHDFTHPRGGIGERIELDIRRHRKTWGRIVVTDRDGVPLSDVKLTLKQTRHHFLFGANLFKLGDFETPRENELFERHFTKIFNHGTLPFYWDTLEPRKGELRFGADSPHIARRPPTDYALAWCLANGIEPKGHWLFCDNFVPDWLKKTPRDLMVNLEERIKILGERYGGKITLWDCVNEAFSNKRWFTEHIGWSVTGQDYVYEVFKLAEKYFPNYTELCYNDGNGIYYTSFCRDNSPVLLLARDLLARGARLGSLGIQFHMYGAASDFTRGSNYHMYFDPHQQFAVLDQYARLGLPLHMTEVSIPTYQQLDRGAAETLQAQLVQNLYSLWFSQERMSSIVWWNPVDKTAYGGENDYDAGLINRDMSVKPAYEALDQLINHRWQTNLSVTTNQDGVADWNGFYADYELTIEAGQIKERRQISLSKDSPNEERIKLN